MTDAMLQVLSLKTGHCPAHKSQQKARQTIEALDSNSHGQAKSGQRGTWSRERGLGALIK